MPGNVGDVGGKRDTGFFTEKGELKVEERSRPSEASKSESSSQSPAVQEDALQNRTSSAFDARRSDVSAQVNKVVSSLNENRSVLQEEKAIAKREKEIVREVADAEKEGRSDDVDAAKKEFSQLQDRRVELEKKAETQNRDQDPDRRFAVRVGNKELGRGEIQKVEVTKQERVAPEDLDSKEGRAKIIESRNQEIESVDAQLASNKQSTRELREVSRSAREELGGLEEKAIRSIREAEDVSVKTRDAILQGGINSVDTNKLDVGVVSRLLAQ